MSKFLMVDIGAGTMDVLWYDTEADLHYKAVVKSPVRYLAEKAAQLPGNLLISGTEMGGGPVTTVLKARAKDAEVVMSASAAATLHHNSAKVRSWGIKIVEDEKIKDLRQDETYSHLVLGDLDIERLSRIVEGFGVNFAFDAVAICAQDHGVPPAGVSHLDYRLPSLPRQIVHKLHRIFRILTFDYFLNPGKYLKKCYIVFPVTDFSLMYNHFVPLFLPVRDNMSFYISRQY